MLPIALYSSIAWRHPLGIGQALEWAQEYGWDMLDARGLSLGMPGDERRNRNAFGYDMFGPRQICNSARQSLKNRLEEAGVPLLCIYCSSSVNLPGERGAEYRELFVEYLQLAADLGVEWVRSINNSTRSLGDAPEMSPEEAYERTVEGSRWVGERAAELGIGFMLENNENTVTPDAPSLARLKQDVQDVCRVGIAYDPVNAYFQGLDPVAGIDHLQGHIDVIHVKNVRRHQEERWDYMPRGDFSYEWVALAEGDLQWPELLGRAVRDGFRGPITFEYVNPFKGMPLEYWDSLREPAEAARVESAYLKELTSKLAQST